MSATMTNWNFQNMNGVTCLTGIVSQGDKGSYWNITEGEIKELQEMHLGIFLKTERGDFFCKYEDIGVRNLANINCITDSGIIKDICYFEKVYLQKEKPLKCLSQEEGSPRCNDTFCEVKKESELIKKLLKGLWKKYTYYDSFLEEDTCLIYVEPTGLYTRMAAKIDAHVLIDDYSKIQMKSDCTEVTHTFEKMSISYVISDNEISLVNLPAGIKNIRLINIHDENYLTLLPKETSNKTDTNECLLSAM